MKNGQQNKEDSPSHSDAFTTRRGTFAYISHLSKKSAFPKVVLLHAALTLGTYLAPLFKVMARIESTQNSPTYLGGMTNTEHISLFFSRVLQFPIGYLAFAHFVPGVLGYLIILANSCMWALLLLSVHEYVSSARRNRIFNR
jgi:hypothetical protein